MLMEGEGAGGGAGGGAGDFNQINWSMRETSVWKDYIARVGVIIGKNQLDCWILENPTNSKLEEWGCIPWIFYLLENVL